MEGSIVQQDIEGRIKADLKEKGLETEGDTITILAKHLAATRALIESEQIDNLIFGNQIFLLKKLNEVAGKGKPAKFIAAHLEHVQGLFPEQLDDLSLDQYNAFLLNCLFIITKGNVFHITNLGVECLTWFTTLLSRTIKGKRLGCLFIGGHKKG